MLGISEWSPYLNLVIPVILFGMWRIIVYIGNQKEANDSERKEIVKEYDLKLQIQADKITKVEKDLAVNQAKDEQTAQALLALGGQIEKSNSAIHERLDKIDTDLREIFKKKS